MRRWFLFGCLLLTCSAAFATSSLTGGVIRFGLLETDVHGRIFVSKQTTTVPFVTRQQDSSFSFGVTVHKKGRFQLSGILHAPYPRTVTANLGIDIESENGRTKISLEEYPCQDFCFYALRLDEGDQPGLYKLEVLIDKQVLRVVEFLVK